MQPIGVADKNTHFVVLVASVKHLEAERRQFFMFPTILYYLQTIMMPKYPDQAIFMPMTDKQTKLIALATFAHARGAQELRFMMYMYISGQMVALKANYYRL